MLRLGILGGSFNPVHLDHIKLAKCVQDTLALDRILFIPNSKPYYKNTCTVSYAQRLEMLALALKGDPSFEIAELEKDPKKTPYSYDTLMALRKEYGPDTPLFFIMGLDSLLYIDEWHRGLELVDLANLVVTGRKNYGVDRMKPAIRELLQRTEVTPEEAVKPEAFARPHGQIIVIDKEFSAVSSSALRQCLEKPQAHADFLKANLNPDVLSYIEKNGLYRQAAGND